MVDERDPYAPPDKMPDKTPEESPSGPQEPPHEEPPPEPPAGALPPPAVTPPPVQDERNGPAWEWRRQLGFFRALVLTLKEVLLSPQETFHLAKREGGLGSPLLFFLIMQIAMNILATLIWYPLANMQRRYVLEQFATLSQQSSPYYNRIETMLMNPISLSSSQIFSQFLSTLIALIIGLFIASGIIHLLLMLFGGARYPFEATFRVVAYVGGACAVLLLFPLCGNAIQLIVWPLLLIMGLVAMHETDTWRALLAVLTPGFLAVLCFGAVVLMLGAMIGMTIKT
jgi:hypothetical protein